MGGLEAEADPRSESPRLAGLESNEPRNFKPRELHRSNPVEHLTIRLAPLAGSINHAGSVCSQAGKRAANAVTCWGAVGPD